MVVGWGLKAEGAVQEELAGGGEEEIGPADDFGDLMRCIVDNTGELVAWQLVRAPDDEVAKVASGNEGLGPEVGVVEFDGFAVGDAESPGDGTAGRARWGDGRGGRGKVWRRAADAGVNGFFVAEIWGGDGGEDVFAGTRAGVKSVRILELFEGGAVEWEA